MSLTLSIMNNMFNNGDLSKKKDYSSTIYTTPYNEFKIKITNREVCTLFSDVLLVPSFCNLEFQNSIGQEILSIDIPTDNIAILLDNIYEIMNNNIPSVYTFLCIDKETNMDKLLGIYYPDENTFNNNDVKEIGIFDYDRNTKNMNKRLSFRSGNIGLADLSDAIYYVMFFDIKSNTCNSYFEDRME